MSEKTGYCPRCGQDTKVILEKTKVPIIVRDREQKLELTKAFCTRCHTPVDLEELQKLNEEEIDEQIRKRKGLVTVKEIEALCRLYNIGKGPLAVALGFGEVTVARYLSGQNPSREYSRIMKKALSDPQYMLERLESNREKMADTAYNKTMAAIEDLTRLFSISPELKGVLCFIFDRMEEVTPLALQKLLYYIQGVSLAQRGAPIFEETCEAWVHGPVYRKVYDLFRDFKYNPIDDTRFSMLQGYQGSLRDEDRELIDMVLNTFGLYSGKVLERITHREKPWLDAREGYGDSVPSDEEISQEAIRSYFTEIGRKFDLTRREGLNDYIFSMLTDQG